MDAQGWVAIDLIASFNRIKKLTSDVAVVVECMRMTPLLEVSPKGKFVRLAQTWPEWTLPNATKNEEVVKEIEEAEEEAKNPKPVEELEEGEIREEEQKKDENAPSTPDKEAPDAPEKDDAAPDVPAKEPTPSIRTLSPRDGAFSFPPFPSAVFPKLTRYSSSSSPHRLS
jgi:hypothetical protein